MKLLNQYLLVLALVAIATSSSFAQPPGGPGGQRPGRPPGGLGEGGGPGQVVLEAIDSDGNHEISADEIANSATALKTLDANEDGKLRSSVNGYDKCNCSRYCGACLRRAIIKTRTNRRKIRHHAACGLLIQKP